MSRSALRSHFGIDRRNRNRFMSSRNEEADENILASGMYEEDDEVAGGQKRVAGRRGISK